MTETIFGGLEALTFTCLTPDPVDAGRTRAKNNVKEIHSTLPYHLHCHAKLSKDRQQRKIASTTQPPFILEFR